MNEELREEVVTEEKETSGTYTWNDVQEMADQETTSLTESESGSGIGLVLAGVAAVGGIIGGAVWLVKKIKKRKDKTPSDVIDGEAHEVEDQDEEDPEMDESGSEDSDVDDRPEK